jgi:hypothetical protein
MGGINASGSELQDTVSAADGPTPPGKREWAGLFCGRLEIAEDIVSGSSSETKSDSTRCHYQRTDHTDLFKLCADLSDATPEAVPQERSKRGAISIANLPRDRFNVLTITMEKRLGVLHAKILKISEGRLTQHGVATSLKCSSACSERFRCLLQREAILEIEPGPAFKTQDHGICLSQMI